MSTSSSVTSACSTFQYTRRYTPQCDLAELIVNEMKVQHFHAPQIIKAMGYPAKHSIAAIDRLRYVLCSPNLGLDGSYIDAFYSSPEFLVELFNILDITPEQYVEEMASIRQRLEQSK